MRFHNANRLPFAAAGAIVLATFVGNMAQAALRISGKPTRNVTCSGGVCTASAKNAILNVGDLAGMLATADVSVQSGSAARDIELVSSLSWTSASRLTLDAYRSIGVAKPLTVAGSGALTLTTDDGGSGGTLSFQPPGRIVFWDLSSSLAINGASYKLVGNLATLISDIAGNPSGNYSLANNYDATPDGTYLQSPVGTTFTGAFEGLGNSISHLAISATVLAPVGLFSKIGSAGSVNDLVLQSFDLKTNGGNSWEIAVGALAGRNDGLIRGVAASGAMRVKSSDQPPLVGGLVGDNEGTIEYSHAGVSMTVFGESSVVGGLAAENGGTVAFSSAAGNGSADKHAGMGGLVGINGGILATVTKSFATGSMTGGDFSFVGGLVGVNGNGSIDNSYAIGTSTGGSRSKVGGLVGDSQGPTAESYSLGASSGGSGSSVGGFVGFDDSLPGSFTNDYWDTDTSGIANLNQGAGNVSDDPGLTGLTNAQLQAGLPAGFNPAIWAEDPSINGGLPYLIANPPPP